MSGCQISLASSLPYILAGVLMLHVLITGPLMTAFSQEADLLGQLAARNLVRCGLEACEYHNLTKGKLGNDEGLASFGVGNGLHVSSIHVSSFVRLSLGGILQKYADAHSYLVKHSNVERLPKALPWNAAFIRMILSPLYYQSVFDLPDKDFGLFLAHIVWVAAEKKGAASLERAQRSLANAANGVYGPQPLATERV